MSDRARSRAPGSWHNGAMPPALRRCTDVRPRPADDEAERALHVGDEAASTGDLSTAHGFYGRAFERLGDDPRVLTRYGWTLALVEHDAEKGAAFCEEAIRRGLGDGAAWLRLAEVHQSLLHRRAAIRALERGLTREPAHDGLHALRRRLGVRRPPVLAFLHRSNWMNVVLGRLRHRLFPNVELTETA